MLRSIIWRQRLPTQLLQYTRLVTLDFPNKFSFSTTMTTENAETSTTTTAADPTNQAVEDHGTDTQNDESRETSSSSNKNKKNWFDKKKGKKQKVKNVRAVRDDSSTTLTQGSYANLAQRKKFHIDLPDHVKVEGDSVVMADGENMDETAKRKMSFLLAYLGSDYSGFQMNDGQKTLQAEFEMAMLRGKLLDPRNFGNPYKYSWSTSGRTDKGVHACAQVVSAKVAVRADQTTDDVREVLNKCLPKDIIVLDVVRTTRNFCAKTQRDRVRYQYMIPSYCLMDCGEMKKIFEKQGIKPREEEGRLMIHLSSEEISAVQSVVKSFRATPEQIQRLKEALAEYEGTKPYHNFSKGIKSGEARAKRYIESFRVEEPILFDGVEWIPTQVLGQSFLIHQIRKMSCMAMDIARLGTPLDSVVRGLSNKILRVNIAPAQGLFLEMSYYGGYNRRKSNAGGNDTPDLDWHTPGSPANSRWNDFRQNVIMQYIAEEEAREGNFISHLYLQDFVNDLEHDYKGHDPKA